MLNFVIKLEVSYFINDVVIERETSLSFAAYKTTPEPNGQRDM